VAHPSQFHHEGWVAVAFVVIFAVAFAFLLSSFAEGGGPAFSFVFVLAVVLAFLDVHEKPSSRPEQQTVSSSVAEWRGECYETLSSEPVHRWRNFRVADHPGVK
jgi:hypothetical protein